jgi:hypothetical protein
MNKVLILICVMACGACSIDGTLQGLFSYRKKTAIASPVLLVGLQDTVSFCGLRYSDSLRVVVGNGHQLKRCLDQLPDAIVYAWNLKCHGSLCYPLGAVDAACKRKGVELFVLAQYYDVDLMAQNYGLARPIFGVDTRHYGTNLTSKYMARFLKDLGIKEPTEHFMYFQNGVLESSFSMLDGIEGITKK